jgi:hypothetical protein
MYQLDNEEYNREENIMHNILYNNSFPIQIWNLPNPKQNQTQNSQTIIPKKKKGPHSPTWAKKPHVSLKYSNRKIAYHTNNTIQDNLTHKTHNHNKFFSYRGIQINMPRLWKSIRRTNRKELLKKIQ